MAADSRSEPRLSNGDRVTVHVDGSLFDGRKGRIVEVQRFNWKARKHFRVELDENPAGFNGRPWFQESEVSRAS